MSLTTNKSISESALHLSSIVEPNSIIFKIFSHFDALSMIFSTKSALISATNKEGNSKALKGIAAYHAQQAIEKILKHKIYQAAPDIDARKMYTHKIYDLCMIAAQNDVAVPKEILLNANKYSDWEAAGRYDLHFTVRTDSVEKAIRLAEEWLKAIK